MTDKLKICEHESVEWILKRIPKFTKFSIIKKLNVKVTYVDTSIDVFVIGTNIGMIFIIDRQNENMESLILKKNIKICNLKLIRTVDLSIAVGFDDGSIYVLIVPFNRNLLFSELIQFIIPSDHRATISSLSWSKNSEKLFSGDINGLIYCTEIDHQKKTVSTYEVYKTQSKVFQLVYHHNLLLISTEIETFLWNCHLNKQYQIGNRPRNQRGDFGVSFVNKLCKNEEIKFIVARPNGKIWISNVKGCIEKTISLKCEMLFGQENVISLLPCITSQLKNDFNNNPDSSKTRFQFGFIVPINESEVLFWSAKSIVIIDIVTGIIIASTCNLGIIQSVSVCNIKVMNPNENNTSASETVNSNQDLYEIWILRQPVSESDNRFVRLSVVPLLTSKMVIDPFYFFSQAKIINNKENSTLNSGILHKDQSELRNINQKSINNDKNKIMSSVTDEESVGSTEEIPVKNITSTQKEQWFAKFGQNRDVSVAINDMYSNVLELTKKTKEAIKQGQLIFENDTEGLEQAIELTEEGLVITFDKNIESPSQIKNEPEYKCEVIDNKIITNNIISQRNRIVTRKVDLIDLEENGETLDLKEPTARIPVATNQANTDEKIITFPSTSLESELYISDISEACENENLDFSPSSFTENSVSCTNEICEVEIISNVPSNEEITSNLTNYSTSGSVVCDIQNISNQDINIVISSTEPIEVSESCESSEANLFDDKLLIPNVSLSNVSSDNFSGSESDDHNLEYTIKSNIDPEFVSIPKDVIENKDTSFYEDINDKLDLVCPDPSDKKLSILTNAILVNSNKWISHRGPNLVTNAKLVSMSVNRRMIWLTDTKGSLHIGFRQSSTEPLEINSENSPNNKMLWLCESTLRTDRIFSSPNGFILYREKVGEVSVYTGLTKIWSPKVVKEKVLLKNNWESAMQGIREIDIDEEMAVIVTKKGQLKVIDGISGRTPYKQSKSADFAESVTMATIFNSIIWCVAETAIDNTSVLSQHMFACFCRDESGNLNIAYWRTVPLPKDLVCEAELHLGVMGGSKMIKSIQLGTGGLGWIVTCDDMCFFSHNITPENPKGDGMWYQLTLQFILQAPSYFEESIAYYTSELQSRVEKIFGYSESDFKLKRVSSSSSSTSIILSVKCSPKKSQGNGLLWITSTERNSPCILFESDKNILGHSWVDCFQLCRAPNKKIIGLPALTFWSVVEISIKNTLWLLHKSGELFCHWNENKIRTVAIPSSFGTAVKIAARNATVIVLSSRSNILYRTGIVSSNPFGLDWKEIKTGLSKQESIKNISCSDNEIWLITESNVYYNEDLQALVHQTSRKLQWNTLNLKLKDSHSKPLVMIQNSPFQNQNRIWGISEHEGYVYMSLWEPYSSNLHWTYVSSPRAKSIHVSSENLWLVEQSSGNIFVRCGLDWKSRPMGDYWIPVPFISRPVIDLAVSPSNQVYAIDSHEQLLVHQWMIVEGVSGSDNSSTSQLELFLKPDDQDWEMLN